jgi:site-specific recombinase XerC
MRMSLRSGVKFRRWRPFIGQHTLTTAWRKAWTGLASHRLTCTVLDTHPIDVMNASKNPFITVRLLGHTDLATTDRYQRPESAHVAELMDERYG